MLDPTQEPEFFVSQSSDHYRPQNYRSEWESNPCLSRWLAPGRNSKRARCTYCDIEMTADICVLKSHGKGARHKRRLMGENLTSNSRYNPAWERDPDYSDWVRPGRVKTRAECVYCDVEFAAETTVLKNHAKSKRHVRAACQAKKLAEMSRVWSAEKLLVDQHSNIDSLEDSKELTTESRRGSLKTQKVRTLLSETPNTCTLTVDEGSCSGEESPHFEGSFDFEGRMSPNAGTLQFEVQTADSEPGVNVRKVTSESGRILNIDASSASENLRDGEETLRNAHLLRSPNTVVVTIEDSSSSIHGAFDSCTRVLSETLKSEDSGEDEIKAVVRLEILCKLCQSPLCKDREGKQLCASCEDAYTEHVADPIDSFEPWLPCKEEGEQNDGSASTTSAGGRPYITFSIARPKGAHSSNACVVQGYDLTSEVQRLVEALRSQVSVLNTKLVQGRHEQEVLERLDKVMGLLNKIKRL